VFPNPNKTAGPSTARSRLPMILHQYLHGLDLVAEHGVAAFYKERR
jgi:hypothetical protein